MAQVDRSYSDYEDLALVSKVISVDRALRETFRKIDNDRYRNFNMMVSDKQWDPEIKQALLDEDRPANTYNLISNVVKLISGKERGGRKKIQVVGRTADDHYSATMMNKVLDWCFAQNRWDYQKTRAVLDAIIARWGVIYNNYSYEDDPLGLPIAKRINPFRLRFDLDFTDYTLKDCNYIEDRSWLTLEEILTKYALNKLDLWEEIERKAKLYVTDDPNRKQKAYVGTVLDRLDGATNYIRNEGVNRNNADARNILINQDIEFFDPISNRFECIDLHERRLEKQWHLFDPWTRKKYNIAEIVQDKSGYGFDNDRYQLLRGQFEDPSALKLTRAATKKLYVTTAIPALNIIPQDKPYPIQNGNFMFTLFFAYDFHSDISETQSVVDEIIDPQSDYNKTRSSMLEMVQYAALRGVTAEEAAIKGHKESWEHPKPGKIKYVNPGMINAIKQDDEVKIPDALVMMAQESKLLVEDLSNATKPAKGMQEGKNESGKYFIAKTEKADEMLVYLFDNIDFSSEQVGRNMVDMIQKFFTQEREIRISDDLTKPEFVRINEKQWNGMVLNDVTVGKYDLETSQMPYGRTDRELEYLKLNDIVKFTSELAPQAAILMLPTLIKASDSPYRNELLTVVEKIIGTTQADIEQEGATKLLSTIQAYLTTMSQQTANKEQELNVKGLEQEQELDGMIMGAVQNTVPQSKGMLPVAKAG